VTHLFICGKGRSVSQNSLIIIILKLAWFGVV